MNTRRDDLGDAAESIANLAREHVAVTLGLGVLAADIAYRLIVRGPLRVALGVSA